MDAETFSDRKEGNHLIKQVGTQDKTCGMPVPAGLDKSRGQTRTGFVLMHCSVS